MPSSLRTNHEYGGYIYKTPNGQYSYTEPVEGEENKSYPCKFNNPPDGNEPTAMYHTHPSDRRRDDYFSGDDYFTAGVTMRMDLYMGRPSGIVKGVGPGHGEWQPRFER